jgi:Ca2+/H+ antiporter, TMEM165/GDT1 family
MTRHWTRIVVGFVLFVPMAIAVFGQAVHYLWNWLMPALFKLPAITFWQAVGLMFLSWVLFGGRRGFGRYGSGYRGPWRRRMRERWEQMTPEERAKFREGMRGRCGGFSPEAQPKP